jgi:DNA-binding HxlR family transcriptional regulator
VTPSRSTPAPGRPVRGSSTGRPVMALLDLLGRRWALRVMWELRDGPVATFRDLQHRCGAISSSVLTDRLRELTEASIVARGEAGYALTTDGKQLLEHLRPLDQWAGKWARKVDRSSAVGAPRDT